MTSLRHPHLALRFSRLLAAASPPLRHSADGKQQLEGNDGETLGFGSSQAQCWADGCVRLGVGVHLAKASASDAVACAFGAGCPVISKPPPVTKIRVIVKTKVSFRDTCMITSEQFGANSRRMNQYIRELRRYAEQYPKASVASLFVGTGISCAAIVAFIELRDRYTFDRHTVKYCGRSPASGPTPEVTRLNAQLAAMLENAKNSSWQQNLNNAADAQQRFMLPSQDGGAGKDRPDYVKKIDERSEEIMRMEGERQAKEKENENDPSTTRFWR